MQGYCSCQDRRWTKSFLVKDPLIWVRYATGKTNKHLGNSFVRVQSLQVSTRTKARSSPDQTRLQFLLAYVWLTLGQFITPTGRSENQDRVQSKLGLAIAPASRY